MAKPRMTQTTPEAVISIIGGGMTVRGDCESSDTIRIDGTVEGSVRAEKAVVIGKDGRVVGDISTGDAKIAGAVKGILDITSRLEVASTAVIDGEIRTARLQLDEGGVVNGSVSVGRKSEPQLNLGKESGKAAAR